MISSESIKEISSIFCGDIEGFYTYKQGYKLVEFFNSYFGTSDVYSSGFPSRWSYVHDKITNMILNDSVDSFLNVVLSKRYLMQEQALNEIKALEKIELIYSEFKRIVSRDGCVITKINGNYHLAKENEDLEFIGEGGFANVYKQISTGIIIKKLKDEFKTDPSIRSRFKREYNITNSLQNYSGIIKVYEYDENSCSYTMECAECTLQKYILKNDLDESAKIELIRQVLQIMKEVHSKDIIHRDISPTNIFLIAGSIKLADFGLGKDLNMITSHRTMYTREVGQYYYCAPEQFMMLKDANKRSDVFSLGRVVNFIMNGDPRVSNHIFKSVAEKATSSDSSYRYADAGQMLVFFEKSVLYKQNTDNKERVENKISNNILDDEVESYIYDLNGEKISKGILDKQKGFSGILLRFMKSSEQNALYVIQSIDKTYQDVCGYSFAAYDPFALFAYSVLSEGFSYVVNEIAANILRYIARDVNRFEAQHLAESLIDSGLEPLIEEILES